MDVDDTLEVETASGALRARPALTGLGAVVGGMVSACGDGSNAGGDASSMAAPAAGPAPAPPAAPSDGAPAAPSATPPTFAQAARFLSQATFGATQSDAEALSRSTFAAWLDAQSALPASTHLANVDAWLAARPTSTTDNRLALGSSLWRVFAAAPDQLRQRMAFALSEIFVISLVPGMFFQEPRLGAGYIDVLTRNALGNYRTLLEAVTLSPAMGVYLSHVKNQKENASTGRMPDENYAREVLQLFSIGLTQLNADGTQMLDGAGNPIATYDNADVTGLAKVFTGFSWGGPDNSNARFNLPLTSSAVPNPHDPNHEILPMQAYPQYHSTAQKRFLGVTIAAQSAADPTASLRIALDTIFRHPNVPPFMARQLIQRLVSSNPSPAYVARVAGVFADNGQGVRGDLGAVARAILLDDEARLDSARSDTAGKLREPVVRLLNWLRACDAPFPSGFFTIDFTENPGTELGQSPLYAPSVFNFFRPGYRPPASRSAAAGLVAPEMQITTENTTAGYLNFMRRAIDTGFGRDNAVKARYTHQLTLAADAAQLVAHLNTLLAGERLGAARAQLIADAVGGVAGSTDAGRLNRVKLAVYLVMAAPEYILQN